MNRRLNRQLPHFSSVDLETGLSWHGGVDYRYEEKIDGWYCEADAAGLYFKNKQAALPDSLPDYLQDCRIVGELKAGTLHAFDIIHKGNRQLWQMPLNERLNWLQEAQAHFPSWIVPIRHGHGGEFLEAILAEGGEGVVAKHLGAFFGKMGAWIKCKRQETHDCLVTARNIGKDSAQISLRGSPVGNVTVPSCVSVGEVIEVRCHSITKSGKLREPVYIRTRHDLTLA